MVETLQARSIFDHVSPYESGIAAAYSLKGRIERLEEVDSALDVKVECAISAELIDTKTGSIIWSDQASETLPVPQRNVKGVVNALTQASHTTVGNLVQSMMKKLAPNPGLLSGGLPGHIHSQETLALNRGPGWWRADRRPQGSGCQRMVRGPALRYREFLQDLCGEFKDQGHLDAIVNEAQEIVNDALESLGSAHQQRELRNDRR
jgi:hypothetical protein